MEMKFLLLCHHQSHLSHILPQTGYIIPRHNYLLSPRVRDWSLLDVNALQRASANEVAPRPDFARDALFLGKLLAHALGEEDSSLTELAQ